MTTTIHSNGSKWHGESPDTVEQLFAVLQTHVLDRMFEFEDGTAFIERSGADDKWAPQGTVRFWGNFLHLSHVFSIDTDEPDLIARLTAAIQANMARPDYQEQPSPQQRREAEEEYRRANDAKREADRIRAARITLGMEA
jgi:hypothetical protein